MKAARMPAIDPTDIPGSPIGAVGSDSGLLIPTIPGIRRIVAEYLLEEIKEEEEFETKQKIAQQPPWNKDYDTATFLMLQRTPAGFAQATDLIQSKELNADVTGHNGTLHDIAQTLEKSLSDELKKSSEWKNLMDALENPQVAEVT